MHIQDVYVIITHKRQCFFSAGDLALADLAPALADGIQEFATERHLVGGKAWSGKLT